jgi:uncharacterized membrane protein
MTIFFLVLLLALPALLIYLGNRYLVFRKIGTVLLCYLTGMLLGNIGILPAGFTSLQNGLSEISVALALPLLLFSIDVRSWFKVAGKAMASLFFAMVSIILVSLVLFLIFRQVNPGAWQLAGMSLGVYTGGTPNLASIKAALDISSTDYIIFHTYDTIFSLIYILLLVSVAQRFFLRYLKPFPNRAVREGEAPREQGGVKSLEAYRDMLRSRGLAELGLALALSAVIVGIFGSLMIHSLFCRWAGIDVDTFLVTSVSAICSPPFVPVVVGALKNPAVLLSGLTTGIVGYAVGNYLGISLAFLFKSLP